MLVYALVHPVFSLLVASIGKIAVGLHKVHILVNHIEYLLHTCAVESAVAQYLRTPSALGHGEEMERVAEVGGCHVTAVHVVAIALVYHDAIANLHDTALYALKLIACACHLNQQEEVNHRVTGRLTLTHTHGLYENLVESRSLAQNDGLASLTCYTTQRTC